MEKARTIVSGICFFFLLMVALLLPSGQMVASMEGFLTIFFLVEWNWKEKGRNLWNARLLLFPWLIFYGLYVAGLCWTENKAEGAFNVQVKLSLFLFPLIIASRRFDTKQTHRLLGTFLFGLIAAGIFMLVRAAYLYYSEGVNNFYYQALAAKMPHPSYLSMYYCVGIMLLFHGILLQSFKPRPWKLLAILLCVFFAVMIFLLSSKLGILSMLLLFAGYIVYAIIRFKRYVVGISALVALVLGCFIALKAFPQVAARLERMKTVLMMSDPKADPSAVESNQARLLVWQADYAVASRHAWTGVGTGDAEDSLKAEYKARGMTGAYNEGLNAHSQLFQTAIVLGIPGLLALLLLIFFPAAWALRNQYGFVVLFALLLFLNLLPESMFERQDGTLFFGFFYSLILFAIDRRSLTPLKAPPLSFL
jgi:O-antigen ligase